MKYNEGIKNMIDRQKEHAKKEKLQKEKEVVKLFDENSRLQIIITGKVQGVFFRSFIQKAASIYKLTGWVKNNSDGSVQVLAEGPKAKLKKLISKCELGPPSAKIEDVRIDWQAYNAEFCSFDIV